MEISNKHFHFECGSALKWEIKGMNGFPDTTRKRSFHYSAKYTKPITYKIEFSFQLLF